MENRQERQQHERENRQRYERREQREPRREKAADNVVFIGKKPSMSYVLAVVTQFGDGQNEVHLKARGRAISKAVDVAEIVKNKFVTDVKVADIRIGTEEVTAENEKINVSTMEILLRK